MNSVVYPPPSARCGNISAAPVDAEASFEAGGGEIRKSSRSLYRVRRLTIEIEPEDETRNTPRNGRLNAGNSSCTNFETWPYAGTTTLAVTPEFTPFISVR